MVTDRPHRTGCQSPRGIETLSPDPGDTPIADAPREHRPGGRWPAPAPAPAFSAARPPEGPESPPNLRRPLSGLTSSPRPPPLLASSPENGRRRSAAFLLRFYGERNTGSWLLLMRSYVRAAAASAPWGPPSWDGLPYRGFCVTLLRDSAAVPKLPFLEEMQQPFRKKERFSEAGRQT